MSELSPNATLHSRCDYAALPHSGGGTDHGSATHYKGGYHICDKCYDAIIEAERRESEYYASAPSPLLSHECGPNMRCRICGSLPITSSATVGEDEIKRFRVGDILFNDEQAKMFCDLALKGLRAEAAPTEEDVQRTTAEIFLALDPASIVRRIMLAPSATTRVLSHTLQGEQDTKLLGAFTPAKTMAPGFEIEYWNLTMVRMRGDVVLSVRLPSEFSHYVQTSEGPMAAWHPGAVSSVRFTRDLWCSFVKQITEADKVFQACDSLDAI